MSMVVSCGEAVLTPQSNAQDDPANAAKLGRSYPLAKGTKHEHPFVVYGHEPPSLALTPILMLNTCCRNVCVDGRYVMSPLTLLADLH